MIDKRLRASRTSRSCPSRVTVTPQPPNREQTCPKLLRLFSFRGAVYFCLLRQVYESFVTRPPNNTTRMTALRDHNVETIDLTMDDELDVITTSSVAPARSSHHDGRALRARHSLGNTITISPKRKRASSFSESTIENHEQLTVGKRQKREEKKAVCQLSRP
jgi:hypothetical protein